MSIDNKAGDKPFEPIDAKMRREMQERAERIRNGIPCESAVGWLQEAAQFQRDAMNGDRNVTKEQIEASKALTATVKTMLTFGIPLPPKAVELSADDTLSDLADELAKARRRAEAQSGAIPATQLRAH